MTRSDVIDWANRQDKLHPGLMLLIAAVGFILADFYAGLRAKPYPPLPQAEIRGLFGKHHIPPPPTAPEVMTEAQDEAIIASAEAPGWHPIHAFGFACYAAYRRPKDDLTCCTIARERATDPFNVFYCDGHAKDVAIEVGTEDDAKAATLTMVGKYNA